MNAYAKAWPNFIQRTSRRLERCETDDVQCSRSKQMPFHCVVRPPKPASFGRWAVSTVARTEIKETNHPYTPVGVPTCTNAILLHFYPPDARSPIVLMTCQSERYLPRQGKITPHFIDYFRLLYVLTNACRAGQFGVWCVIGASSTIQR